MIRSRCVWGTSVLLGLLGSLFDWTSFTVLRAQEPTENPVINNHHSHSRKKLIEWGTDEPNTQYFRAHVKEMEQLPFDGLVLHLNGTPYGNFSWETWGPRRYELDEFRGCIEDLQASKSDKLTELFLRVNVTPGTADWFDDPAWETIRHNFRVAAAVAKAGGCRGLMFDTEQYQGDLFAYEKQPQRSFEEYQQQLRKRGKDWIQQINQEFPDIVILIPFSYPYTQPRSKDPAPEPGMHPRSRTHYGMLADFLDGVLEGCSDQTILVDAFEQSYPYRHPEQFQQAYQRIMHDARSWTSVPEEYRHHLEAGFGVWMDNRLKNENWDVNDFQQNYFTPDQFRDAVRAALLHTDRYVWIYTDRPRWWTNENLPPEYIEALRQARESTSTP